MGLPLLSEANLPAARGSREASAPVSTVLGTDGSTNKDNHLLKPGFQQDLFVLAHLRLRAFQSAAATEGTL